MTHTSTALHTAVHANRRCDTVEMADTTKQQCWRITPSQHSSTAALPYSCSPGGSAHHGSHHAGFLLSQKLLIWTLHLAPAPAWTPEQTAPCFYPPTPNGPWRQRAGRSLPHHHPGLHSDCTSNSQSVEPKFKIQSVTCMLGVLCAAKSVSAC